jgi:hypothetical protein
MSKIIFPTLLRALGTFAVFCGVQYIIPWYLLAPAGIVAGAFMLKTSDDRPTSLGILIGSIGFAIFAYIMAQMFPMK